MKKKIYLLIAISTISVSAQVGIGVDAAQINASAQLDVSSTTKGLLTPRMTELQRQSINQPAAGLLVYQTDSIAGFYYYDGSVWKLNLGLSPGGTIGQVLTTDGAGNAGWAAAASGTPGVDLTTNQTVDGLKTFSSDVLINGITLGIGKFSGMFGDVPGNTAVGNNVLSSNEIGINNTAVGTNALESNTEGNENTANGVDALKFNTTGSGNTANGLNALVSNKVGNDNTANGLSALLQNTGSFNTANGSNSLLLNTTGNRNTANGYKALFNNKGDNNTALGAFADVATGDLTNSTAIGYSAKVNASNTIQLGNVDVTNVRTAGTITAGAVTYPNTDGSANQVLTTDGAGNATWATAAGGSSVTVGAVGAATTNGASITAGELSLSPADGTNPGIVTTSAQTFAGEKSFSSKVTIGGVDGFLANAATSATNGSIPTSGPGTRMMWYPKKSAFRAGSVSGVQWNESNTGLYSIATGYNTTASGNSSTALGSITTASGSFSTALGDNTIASGDASIALGYATKARSYVETVIGINNADYTPSSTTEYVATDRLFVIGNGLGPIYDIDGYDAGFDTKNALVMLKNGNTTFSGKITTGAVTYPNTDGTANQVLTTNGAGIATWATAAGGSSITMGAVGLVSTPNGASITNGVLRLSPASGSNPGIVTTGAQSINGEKTFTSKAVFSGTDGFLATGTITANAMPATGAGARMMWVPSKKAFRAGVVNNTQWNYSNIGDNSTAMGYNTTASGDISTAIGNSTTAKSFGETVIGMYNTDATALNPFDYNANDRLFVIGNGAGPLIDAGGELSGIIERKDALVMLKNGNTIFSGTVTAPSFPTSSDKRLKQNITPLKQSIAAVMQLNPVSYEKKQSLASTDYNMKENGFIAQELQKVMPTLVTEGTDKDKLLSVNYIALIPVLTKAIQEQQKEIETLKALVEKLINQQKQ